MLLISLNMPMDTTNIFKILLMLVLLAFALLQCKAEDTKSKEEEDLFVPTKEWQVVNGQKLPRGIHVRIDLKTGQKHAKLLNPSQEKTKAVQIVTSKEEDSTKAGNLELSEQSIKEALKNIKDEDRGNNKDHPEHINKLRTYEELKRELGSLNLNPKSDFELLQELLTKFKKLMKAKNIDKLHVLSVIEDLDYLVHQYDNAIEFVRLKGFEEVIYKNLNSSMAEIMLESIKLLGTLVQNNVKVQIYALETGSLDFLIRKLVLNSNYKVKSRVLFALSSLLRHFPLAQLKFIENAGLSAFLELISNTNGIKIQLKTVTVINDLVLEYIEALDDQSYPEKTSQYKKINLKHKLKELNWCKYLTVLLKNVYEIDNRDHDGIEKSLSAILSIVDDCDASHINSVHDILKDLQFHYSTLATTHTSPDDEFDADYYKHMQSLCTTIIDYNNVMNKYRTEL